MNNVKHVGKLANTQKKAVVYPENYLMIKKVVWLLIQMHSDWMHDDVNNAVEAT